METAVISYRVADFLKKHAPFSAIADEDLLALAGNGRVRFHEPNQFILWQGEPHRLQVFVIQQGTVSLWSESSEGGKLRDVRGAGDLLGIDRYNEARACLYTARSDSDVVIYAFPAADFEAYVLKYPHAVQYVAAESRVTPDYQTAGARRDFPRIFLHDVVGGKTPVTCSATTTIAEAARQLITTGAEAIAVMNGERRTQGLLTADTLLRWLAGGTGTGGESVAVLLREVPATVAPDVSVAEGMLVMGTADAAALAITHDGTPDGRLQAVVTRRSLAPLIGDDPATLLQDIRRAGTFAELQALNQRVRAFALEQLTSAAAVEWLARLTSLADAAILDRIVSLTNAADMAACWCFAGASGRGESLTMLLPTTVAIFDDAVPAAAAVAAHQRVIDALTGCGYLSRGALPFERSFYAAGASTWKSRYSSWVHDPVMQQTYRARSFFDLRPVCGRRELWGDVRQAATNDVDRNFVFLLANDCLESLPPLTFFEDAVIDSGGEQATTFRLEHSALRPLVDVGRVFALAGRDFMASTTIERFATGRALLPEQDAVFREAADTFRIVLWQQGRVGISQGTGGAELPPALLSRHDRQVLKRGFRSILQLLEFTAALDWLEEL